MNDNYLSPQLCLRMRKMFSTRVISSSTCRSNSFESTSASFECVLKNSFCAFRIDAVRSKNLRAFMEKLVYLALERFSLAKTDRYPYIRFYPLCARLNTLHSHFG